LTGAPDGDQLLDLFQLPLLGLEVVPDGPFQSLVVMRFPPANVLLLNEPLVNQRIGMLATIAALSKQHLPAVMMKNYLVR
jgi:hypothetical protein